MLVGIDTESIQKSCDTICTNHGTPPVHYNEGLRWTKPHKMLAASTGQGTWETARSKHTDDVSAVNMAMHHPITLKCSSSSISLGYP